MSSVGIAPPPVVFDLDGTLIDSIHDIHFVLNTLLAEEGLSPLDLGAVKSMVGRGVRPLIREAVAAAGVSHADEDAWIERFVATYLRHPADHTVVFPGVREILADLSEAGIPLGICTNKPRLTTAAALEALGLKNLFRAVTCPEDVAHRKPDGRHLLDTLTAMGCPADGAVYVGDSETDVAAARNAGIPVVLVTFGYAHQSTAALGADALVSSFYELPGALASIRGGRKMKC